MPEKRERRGLPKLRGTKQSRNVQRGGKAKRPVYKEKDEDEGLTEKQKATVSIAEALSEGLAGGAPRTGAGLILARIAQGAHTGAKVGEAIAKYRNRKRRKSLSKDAESER